MSKIGFKPVTMKDCCYCSCRSHQATGMHREALAPTYYYSHSYYDSSVMAPISKWCTLPMRKWDETQFTTKYPRQDETQFTTKHPRQDETQVTTKYPRQDETQFTTKYPRQDETQFTTKYPRQDETQFTTKYPRQDETQVTKYWVFGPLTKNSHIQDGLLTISQAPIINIKTGIIEGGEITT